MKNLSAKRFLALTAVLCLLFGCLPLNASAAVWGEYAIVSGTSTLNLRSGPGTEYAWLGRAAESDWVQIHSESGNWYYVTIVESGLSGFMSKNFLKLSGNTSGGTTGIVSNPKATQFLNLRVYPSYSAPVQGIYYNGAAFSVLSYSNGWYQVLMTDGNTGYFREEFVSIYGSASEFATVRTFNGGKLNLRSGPSHTASIRQQVANGRQVSVLLKGNYFWKVAVDGAEGYMDVTFLTAGSSGTATGGTTIGGTAPGGVTPDRPQTQGYAIVNNPKATQYLNLRAQPSTTAKVIAQYRNGIRFEVIEQGETWCKVYGSATGNIGYMMTKYLSLYGLPSSPTKTVQNGNTYVNLRSAPSKETGAVYQRVYSGATVTVLTPGDEWTQVRYGNTTGYMMSWFLK